MSKGDEFMALHDRRATHRKEPLPAPAAPTGSHIAMVRELATERQLRTLLALYKQAAGKWPSTTLSSRWRKMERRAAQGLIEAYRTQLAR